MLFIESLISKNLQMLHVKLRSSNLLLSCQLIWLICLREREQEREWWLSII